MKPSKHQRHVMRPAVGIQALVLTALIGMPLGKSAAQADELKLKDGTKIVGTIVGFEENSFKVKTSYGFAMVQKDQVVAITMSDAAAPAKPAAEAKPPTAKPARTEPAPDSATPKAMPASKSEPKVPADSAENAPAAEKRPANASDRPAASAMANPPASAKAPAPAKPVELEPVREEVNGNLYTNLTYGFRMYKPPSWQVVEGARTVMPGAIAAMGTFDQTTYLLIGEESAGKSASADIAAAEQRLREVMTNFRPLGESHITVSGVPSLEKRFRGSVDNHDWSGVVVFVPHDTRLYTIFGMTLADTDLVQIQENVISRTISSLQFTK